MATIRDECLNAPCRAHVPNGRMRRVSDLSEADSSGVFYEPLALRVGGFRRYPCWDPTGASVDLRAESLVVDVGRGGDERGEDVENASLRAYETNETRAVSSDER